MTTRVTRQQATNIGGGGLIGAAKNKLQLRNGNGKQTITLAKWMTLQHAPEHGIVGKTLPLHDDDADDNDFSMGNTDGIIASSAERAAALSLKAKKDAAIDSKFAPTTKEIHGHVRYLSEEGMKLIMRDIDACARESLRYSAKVMSGNDNSNDAKDAQGSVERVNNLCTLAKEIHEYIESFQPHNHDYNEPNNVTNKASDISVKDDGLGDILADMFQFGTKRNYNPSLLPFITVKCYPNILDRSEMIKTLSKDLSNRSNTTKPPITDRKRPSSSAAAPSLSSCVVTITSSSKLVQQGHLVAEILSQCISNDPNGEEYAMELTRQRKRLKSQISRIDIDEAPRGSEGVASIFTSVWSWTDSLVNWCSTVDCFDSIIVLLEDVENVPSPTLDAFITTLISLRSFHGIPISVVLMDSMPGGLGDRLSRLRNPSNHDSGGGDGGIAACELELPLPQIQFDIFVNKLFFSGKCIPSFLWTNKSLWSHMLEQFHEFDNSIISLARHLKTELRRYFAVPGAFLTLLHCEDFVVPNESRLQWLFGEKSSRAFLSIEKMYESEVVKEDGNVADLTQKIQISFICHQLLQKIYTIIESTPVHESRTSTISQSNIENVVSRLIYNLRNARQKLSAHLDGSVSMQMKLDEYIILLLHMITEGDPNIQMAKALLEDIISSIEEYFPIKVFLREPLPPLIQPRRDIAKELTLPPHKAFSKHSLAQATRTAFQVFQGRVMTLSDWYNKYFEVVTESKDTDSSEAAFFFAVYELVLMGFMQKLVTGRKSEETYEKVAIVWGSGR